MNEKPQKCPWELNRVKCLASLNGTYDNTGSQVKTVSTSVTTQTSSQPVALEPCIKAKVGKLLTS